MKKEIKISLLILVGFLSFLWLEKPTREFLGTIEFEPQIAKQISGIAIRLLLIVAIVKLIQKLHLQEFTGLNSWRNYKNIQAVLGATAFVAIGLASNWNTYMTSEKGFLLLFATSTFAVGIVEELTFRGAIFPLLIQSLSNTKQPILKSALLSSGMFGMVHFVNLFSQPENFIGIISQVFFATAIGVFFCGLMVRTENILIPCVLHALVNFSFGAGELKQTIQENSSTDGISAVNWNSLIPTSIFFSFILLGGVYMILKTNKENILNKLTIR
jgi:membrane protease YdiL (CAAX protease family)